MVQRNDAALLLVTPTPHQPLINDGNPVEQQNTFKVRVACMWYIIDIPCLRYIYTFISTNLMLTRLKVHMKKIAGAT